MSPKKYKPVFAQGFIAAVRIILCNWKSKVRTKYREWVQIMTKNASFEL